MVEGNRRTVFFLVGYYIISHSRRRFIYLSKLTERPNGCITMVYSGIEPLRSTAASAHASMSGCVSLGKKGSMTRPHPVEKEQVVPFLAMIECHDVHPRSSKEYYLFAKYAVADCKAGAPAH